MTKKTFNKAISGLFLFLFLSSFSHSQSLDIQGHRGARGYLPENSIPGFIKAIQMGCSTLEMDVVISKDREVVVSHEPWLNASICTDSLGQSIPEGSKEGYNLYEMNYAAIRRCDCGSMGNPRFAEQQKQAVYKPRLAEVIDSVEHYLKVHSLPPVRYNIEIKSMTKTDGVFHPEPSAFVEMVMEIIKEKKLEDRVIIQSFDFRPLHWIKQYHSGIKVAVLLNNEVRFEKTVDNLDFKPDVYSPNHLIVSKKMVKNAHAQGIKVIPWTVNTEKSIKKMLKCKVDGIISDYPDRVKALAQ